MAAKPVATAPKEKMVTLAPPPPSRPAPAVAPSPVKTSLQSSGAGKIVVASLEPMPHPSPMTAADPTAPSVLAALEPLPRPRPKPAIPALALDDDTAASATAIGTDWTIQIGAFGNATLAQSELAAYARKSSDVLGQAARIVSPLESPDGHMLFRARFGPFDEGHARQVCQFLTQRGQTCFAAITSR